MIATVAMAMLAATICQPDNIRVDPRLLVKIAQHESGLRIDAVNLNTNGTHDWGATQINESNFSWLNIDAAELIDQTDIVVRGEVVPRGLCVAMLASAKVLTSLSRYNSGSPTKSLPYAAAVIGTQMPSMPASAVRVTAQACPEPDLTGWHVAAPVSGCRTPDDPWHTISKQEFSHE